MGLTTAADGAHAHCMPPTTMQAMKKNMPWDGWFHAAAHAHATIGVFVLLDGAR
jgi:uncharacterized membrane protein